MAENGILSNVGLTKRSATGITAMGALLKLGLSDGNFWLIAGVMVGTVVLAVVYMVLDYIKQSGKEIASGDK